ncbi:MAG TPA: exodeoxyribonuclease VII small subunit [bacterium]|nr:exodeoxyribonuclease VII small subunit [bacterium]
MTRKGELTYAEAIEELEEIVAAIENEDVEVDSLLEKVKRASFLLRYCREKLRHTDEEVKKVLSETAEIDTGDKEKKENGSG